MPHHNLCVTFKTPTLKEDNEKLVNLFTQFQNKTSIISLLILSGRSEDLSWERSGNRAYVRLSLISSPFRDEREELRTSYLIQHGGERLEERGRNSMNVFNGCFQNREIEEWLLSSYAQPTCCALRVEVSFSFS